MSHSKPHPPSAVIMPGGPFLDEAALQEAVRGAPDGVKNTVLHLHNTYKALAILRTFHHKLSDEQLWRTCLVRSADDWADIAGRFLADVDLHGLLAFDTESYRPTSGGRRRDKFAPPAPTRILYAVASTACGYTAVFDLESLNRGSPLGNGDVFSVLPPPFRRWIEDPAVLILGSNVAVDLQDPSLRATSLVDTRVLWRQFLAPSSDPAHQRGKLIKVYGIGNRDGLQVQALWAKGFPYKPTPEDTFVRLFGSHPYRDSNGNSKWPWFRNAHIFYQWWRTAAGGIRQEHLFYLFHDSTTPISLAIRLVLERVIQVGAIAVFPSGKSTAEVFRSFFQDFAVTKPAPVLSAPASAEDSADSDVVVLPPPSLPNIGLEYESEDPELDSPPAAVSLPAPLWRQRDLSNMPYEANPSFGHHCTACGSSSHSFLWNNQEACPEYLDFNRQTRLTCFYELCKSKRGDHNTKVCPLLHHICQVCWCRGHFEADRCADWDLAQWANNRRFWEDAADHGLYTSARRTHWNLGFFAHRPYTPYPYPVNSYKELADMPFPQARALILNYAQGTWIPPPQTKRTAGYAHLSPDTVEALKRRRPGPSPAAAEPSWAPRPQPPSLFAVQVPAPPGWASSSAMDTASPKGPPPRVLPSFLDRVRAVRARARAFSDPPATPPAVAVSTECLSAPPRLGASASSTAGADDRSHPVAPDSTSHEDSSAAQRSPNPMEEPASPDRLPSPEPGPSRYHGLPPAGYSSSDDDEEETLECFLRPVDRRF